MPVEILALCGSLRKESYNRKALRAAQELAPPSARIETFEIGTIPLYNEDLRADGYPPVVADLRDRIARADAILFVSPEYNYSVPGVLKNAIDWASRPPKQPFDGKPVAIMGASPGMLGTARGQYHLRQVCAAVNMFPVNRPEIMISFADKKFDETGKLTDEAARKFIRQLLEALVEWTVKIGAPRK
jgi:chromate reductase